MIKRFKIRTEGKEYNVEVEGVEGTERVERTEGGIKERSTATKEKEYHRKQETPTGEEKRVLSPMPAKIVKVNCKKGDGVKKGDVLLVIEAMKMENEIVSPAEGIVKEVRTTEGVTVSQGDVLVVFE